MRYEITFIENEPGFENGWYILNIGDDNHILWQSLPFKSEEQANQSLEKLINE